ncbi:MAG: hypothetical protein ACI841_001706 [Planctomycetota bacterium]|jgi:hypothetical protein
MKLPVSSLALIGALLASPSSAQDSVSKLLMAPGDAISAYEVGEQVNDYVVDIVPFDSSWGNTYGIAPIVKASENSDFSPPYFTHLISGQAMSRDTAQGVPFLRGSYKYWNQAGFGVHQSLASNDVGTDVIPTSAIGSQFAAVFSEFGFSQAAVNNVITSIVNFDPAIPSRLYVSRIISASNASDYTCDLSQHGIGGVDANGMTTMRTDGFNSVDGCGLTATLDQNYYRIDAAARANGAQNILHNGGATDAAASTHLVNNASTVHVTPTVIPASMAGGTRLIGTTFANSFVYENPIGNVISTSSHLATGVGGTRGSMSHTMDNFTGILGAGSTLGTGALLGQNGNGETVQLALWGLGATGAPSGNLRIDLPAVMTDPTTGWASNALGAGPLEFTNHSSQTSFRGANGQVAVGKDKAGRMLVAASVVHPNSGGVNNAPTQLIGVARVPAGGGAAQWTIASYNDNSMGAAGTGKPILDGPGGSIIGRLVSLDTMSGGGQPGPSVTSPMIDSHGNLYYIAAVELFLGGGLSDFGTGLIRAVYNEANFSYELELVWDSGRDFHGLNSDRDYQVRFVDLADSNSISSAAAFSGNISGGAYNGVDSNTLDEYDHRALNSLVINAQILYDVDQDGDFEPQTGSAGTPFSDDEDYRVLLYVTISEDCNDNGVGDDLELLTGMSNDINGNGIPDDCEDALGSNYCLSVPNSSTQPAVISASGSTSVSANLVALFAQPLPSNQPGIFYYGPNQITAVFGNGFRCVGAGALGLARLPVTNSGAGGVMITNMDLTNPATPQTQILPGSTWNFQAWFRDPLGGGAFYNLSDGLEITFTP